MSPGLWLSGPTGPERPDTSDREALIVPLAADVARSHNHIAESRDSSRCVCVMGPYSLNVFVYSAPVGTSLSGVNGLGQRPTSVYTTVASTGG